MKPLPTLTKPLRSVDIETKEPAPGAARANRLVHRAGRRRGGGGDGGARARRGVPREVRRRPHGRREGGAQGLRGAHRLEARIAARSCSWVSWAPASPPAPDRSPPSSAREALDSDRELEQQLGEPIESFFDREGEDAFRAREEEVVLELLARPDAAVVALGGGALASERVRGALGAHTVVHLEVEPDEAWRRASGKGRPLARDRGRFEQLHGDRCALYASVADAVVPPSDRDALRRALPALRALGRGAGRHAARVGVGVVGRLPGVPRPRADRVRLLPPARRAPVRGHGRERGARPAVRGPRADRHDGRRGAQDDPRRRVRAARARGRPAPSEATSSWRWAAAWSATSPASARRSTSAGCGTCRCRRRSWHRWTRPTAARPGVDLPEGKNYAGAFHQPSAVLCDPAALETLPPEELAAGYAEVVKTALIAGGPLWARVRAGRRGRRRGDPGLRSHEARRGGRGRAGRRPPPGAQPGPHDRACDRVRHRLHALPARRGGGDRPACRAAPLGPGGAAGRRWPSCLLHAGCRPRSLALPPTTWWSLWLATRSARAGGYRSCSWRRQDEVSPGHEVGADDLLGAVRGGARRVRHRVEVMHGVNFDVLGSRNADHYGGLTLTELEVKVKALRARARDGGELLPDEPRGRVLRAAAPRGGERRRRWC